MPNSIDVLNQIKHNNRTAEARRKASLEAAKRIAKHLKERERMFDALASRTRR